MKTQVNVVFELNWERREDAYLFVTCPQIALYSAVVPATYEGRQMAISLLVEYLKRNLHGLNYDIS